MKVFAKFHEALEAVISGAENVVQVHGRELTREGALRCLGYDGAKERGLLTEYKRKVLDL